MLLADAAADAAAATGVTPDASPSWLTDITGLLSQGVTAYTQLQLMNLNKNLIAQGRPPLSAYQVASMAPQLNVGLASSTQTLVMYGLIGAGAVLLLSSFMGGRRRR